MDKTKIEQIKPLDVPMLYLQAQLQSKAPRMGISTNEMMHRRLADDLLDDL